MDSNEATAWRQRVQRARARAGWTQLDLADEADVSPGTIKGLERERDPRTPHATTRLKIEEALSAWWDDGIGDIAQAIVAKRPDGASSINDVAENEREATDVDVVLRVVLYSLEGLHGAERSERIDAIMRAALGLPPSGSSD